MCESGKKWCMYFKKWFKANFALFLTRLFCKLKFVITMVDFPLPQGNANKVKFL
jgi:hypothetical protein